MVTSVSTVVSSMVADPVKTSSKPQKPASDHTGKIVLAFLYYGCYYKHCSLHANVLILPIKPNPNRHDIPFELFDLFYNSYLNFRALTMILKGKVLSAVWCQAILHINVYWQCFCILLTFSCWYP